MDIGVNHLDQIIVKSMYKKNQDWRNQTGNTNKYNAMSTLKKQRERGGAVSAPKPSSIESILFNKAESYFKYKTFNALQELAQVQI